MAGFSCSTYFFFTQTHIFRAALDSSKKGAGDTETQRFPLCSLLPHMQTLLHQQSPAEWCLCCHQQTYMTHPYHSPGGPDCSFRLLPKQVLSQPHTNPLRQHGIKFSPRNRKTDFSTSPQWQRGERGALWKDLLIIIAATTIIMQVDFHGTHKPPLTLARLCTLS